MNKAGFQAYTIERTVYILRKSEDADKENERRLLVDTYFLRNKIRYLQNRLEWYQNDDNQLRKALKTLIIESHIEFFKKVNQDNIEKTKKASERRQQLLAQCMKLRARLRSGKLINTAYQRLVGPINREIEKLNYLLDGYHISDTVTFPLSEDLAKLNIKIDYYDVEHYFMEHKGVNDKE